MCSTVDEDVEAGLPGAIVYETRDTAVNTRRPSDCGSASRDVMLRVDHGDAATFDAEGLFYPRKSSSSEMARKTIYDEFLAGDVDDYDKRRSHWLSNHVEWKMLVLPLLWLMESRRKRLLYNFCLAIFVLGELCTLWIRLTRCRTSTCKWLLHATGEADWSLQQPDAPLWDIVSWTLFTLQGLIFLLVVGSAAWRSARSLVWIDMLYSDAVTWDNARSTNRSCDDGRAAMPPTRRPRVSGSNWSVKTRLRISLLKGVMPLLLYVSLFSLVAAISTSRVHGMGSIRLGIAFVANICRLVFFLMVPTQVGFWAAFAIVAEEAMTGAVGLLDAAADDFSATELFFGDGTSEDGGECCHLVARAVTPDNETTAAGRHNRAPASRVSRRAFTEYQQRIVRLERAVLPTYGAFGTAQHAWVILCLIVIVHSSIRVVVGIRFGDWGRVALDMFVAVLFSSAAAWVLFTMANLRLHAETLAEQHGTRYNVMLLSNAELQDSQVSHLRFI